MSDTPQTQTRLPGNPQSTTGSPANRNVIDLVELMYRLLSSWKLIVCLSLVLAVAAWIYTSCFITPLYEATSVIYVLSGESAIDLSAIQIGNALTQDYVKVFNMWEVHAEVISNLNLPYSYSQMRGMLSINNDINTRMIDITVSSPSPEAAAMIANEYANVASKYIADTMATDKPNIMSVALVPQNPVSPSLAKNVMMGFVLGMIFGVGIVTMRMVMDDKYKTAEEIRRYTNLITLAVIPFEEDLDDIDDIDEKKAEKAQHTRRKI